MDTAHLSRIAAAVPPTLPVPASLPAKLAAVIDWPALPPIARLVVTRLFGRKADRDAVAAAWDEARDCGLTMRDLVLSLRAGELREAALAKISYANRHGD